MGRTERVALGTVCSGERCSRQRPGPVTENQQRRGHRLSRPTAACLALPQRRPPVTAGPAPLHPGGPTTIRTSRGRLACGGLHPPRRRSIAVTRAAAHPPRLPPAAVPVPDTSPSGAPATDRLATSPPPSVTWGATGAMHEHGGAEGERDAGGAKGNQAACRRPSNVELAVARRRLHVLLGAVEPLVGVSTAGSGSVARPVPPGWARRTFELDKSVWAENTFPWTF